MISPPRRRRWTDGSERECPDFWCTDHQILFVAVWNREQHQLSSHTQRVAFTMESEKIGQFLQAQRDEGPEALQHYFLSLEDYYERKLWRELQDLLVEFYGEEESAKQRIPIYNNFVKTFADKLNQLKLVKIGLSTASQCPSMQQIRRPASSNRYTKTSCR